jgi:hypothetical protein
MIEVWLKIAAEDRQRKAMIASCGVTPFSVAKRRQHIAAGVSPQNKVREKSSREAATAEVIPAAASRLTFRLVPFRGLTPTAMCCRRFAADVCNSRTCDHGFTLPKLLG